MPVSASLRFAACALLLACSQPKPAADAAAPATGAPPPAAAAAAPAAAEPAAAAVETDPFTVSTSITREGSGQTLLARVQPAAGYHINLEFPWALTVAADAPVLGGTRIGKSQARQLTPEEASFALAAPADGSGTVEASLRMSVCNDTECRTPTQKILVEAGRPVT